MSEPTEPIATSADVVILSWNDGDLLDAAVSSALGSGEVSVNVLVIDNGSEPPVSDPRDPRVRVVRNSSNRGVAPARNQGVSLAAHPYVCFLDSDARLHPNALTRLIRELERDPSVALAAPVFAGQPREASAGRAPTLLRKLARVANLRDTYASNSPPDADAWDVDFAIGACQVFRREAFDQVGGLDESYFYGPEDVDFCLRLREAGWRIVQVGSAEVDHPPRRRFRGIWSRRGAQHALAVSRHLWRHRNFRRRVNRQ